MLTLVIDLSSFNSRFEPASHSVLIYIYIYTSDAHYEDKQKVWSLVCSLVGHRATSVAFSLSTTWHVDVDRGELVQNTPGKYHKET